MTTLQEINVARSERGLLVGETGTGKSTLANALLDNWTQNDRFARVLVIDSKPRFRATWDHTGLSAAYRYRHWRQGVEIPHSYRIRVGGTPRELHQLWNIARANTPHNRGTVIIAQVPINEHHAALYYPWLDSLIRAHYADINKKWWNYFYIDEMLAFMRVSRRNQIGAIQVITAGRELGHTFLGGTQRPFWIPKEAMSEMTKLYAFKVSTDDDLERISKIGLPRGFRVPTEYYQFHFFDKKSDTHSFMKLPQDMADKYGGPAPS